MLEYRPERGRALDGISDEVLHSLLAVMRLPHDVNPNVPDGTWLEQQTTSIHGLDPSVKSSNDLGDRVVAAVSCGGAKAQGAVLCPWHERLDETVISVLTQVIWDECTVRCKLFRRWRRKMTFVPLVDEWVREMGELAGNFPRGRRPPAVEGHYVVRSECQACMCAVVGGREILLAGLAASVRSRCEKDEYGNVTTARVTGEVPPLERVVWFWIGMLDRETMVKVAQIVGELSTLLERTREEIARRTVEERLQQVHASPEAGPEESDYQELQGDDGIPDHSLHEAPADVPSPSHRHRPKIKRKPVPTREEGRRSEQQHNSPDDQIHGPSTASSAPGHPLLPTDSQAQPVIETVIHELDSRPPGNRQVDLDQPASPPPGSEFPLPAPGQEATPATEPGTRPPSPLPYVAPLRLRKRTASFSGIVGPRVVTQGGLTLHASPPRAAAAAGPSRKRESLQSFTGMVGAPELFPDGTLRHHMGQAGGGTGVFGAMVAGIARVLGTE